MADAAFAQKLAIEGTLALGSSLYYEYKMRGPNFKNELDQVIIATTGVTAAMVASTYMVAPNRSKM